MNLVADDFSECIADDVSVHRNAKPLISLWLYRYVACLSRSSLDQRGLGSSDDGNELVIGHVDGALELSVVASAERCWTSITTVQDIL